MREKWVDNVKGFAIYLVVLGHCIQYASHDGYAFRDNIVFEVIYSFHMPLFMLISGYLFWYTLNKYPLWNGIWAKVKGIMVPCMVWGGVTYIVDILITSFEPISLKGYWHYIVYSNWFLWAVFYCSLVGFASKYIFKSKIIGYVIILICNYFCPVISNTGGAKRLMPFFILGIIINQFGVLNRLEKLIDSDKRFIVSHYEEKCKLICFCLLSLIYVIVMIVYPNELFTGTVGSLLVCYIFYAISDSKKINWFGKIGEVSIGIYLLTGIVFWFFIKEYCRITESYRYAIRVIYVFGLSIVLTLVSYYFCKLLQKFKITSILFLGRK